MSLVTKILTYDQLHDLWGAGFTIVRRNPDPFEIDAKLIPRGMSYQWNPITSDGLVGSPEGWKPVPYARHEGVFAPWGTSGFIERDGLALGEKPQVVVDLHRGAARAAAAKLVDDWANKTAADGIFGETRVGTQTKPDMLDTLEQRILRSGDIGAEMGMAPIGYIERLSTKTVETTAKIPKDMVEHMAAIFAERDRLEAEVVRKDRTLAPGPIADQFYAAIEADKGAPWWPTLRAILLPIAVDNVRANLTKDTPDE